MPSTLPHGQDNIVATTTAYVSTPVGTTTALSAKTNVRYLILGVVFNGAGSGTCVLQGLSGGAQVLYINRTAAGYSYYSFSHPIALEVGAGLEAVVGTSAGTLAIVYAEV